MRKTIAGIPVWMLAVVGLGGGYLVWRRRQKNAAATAAATAQQPASTTAGGYSSSDPVLVAYQAGEASGTAAYSAGAATGIGLVESIMGSFPTVTAQPGGAGTGGAVSGSSATAPGPAAAPPAPAQPGYGVIQTAQGPMIVLGQLGSSTPGYNVGGGSPVYFGNANASAQGQAAETPGSFVYTPEAYANFVASTPQNTIY